MWRWRRDRASPRWRWCARPRVAVASTGDELYEAGTKLPSGGIYESNRYTLIGLLRRLDCAVTDVGILRDERDGILPVLREAAATHC